MFGKWNWFKLLKNENEVGKLQVRGKLLKNEMNSIDEAGNDEADNPAVNTDTEFQQKNATEMESTR